MATGGLNSAIRQSLGVCVCVVCPRACVCVMQIMSSDPAVVYNSKLHSNLFFYHINVLMFGKQNNKNLVFSKPVAYRRHRFLRDRCRDYS